MMETLMAQIQYTRVESSPALETYIREKLINTVEKLIGSDPATRIDVEVGRDSEHHRKGEIWFAEVTGATPYGYIRVRREASDIHAAIDLAEEGLKSELTSAKGKITTKALRAARRAKDYIRFSRLTRFFRKK